MKIISDVETLKVLKGQLSVDELQKKEKDIRKVKKLPKKESKIYIDDKWLVDEETVKLILEDFFLNRRDNIIETVKNHVHLNNKKDPYSEADFIVENLKDKNELILFKELFDSIESYSLQLYDEMSQSLLYNNAEYVVDLLYSQIDTGIVIRRALINELKGFKGSDLTSQYIARYLKRVYDHAKSFGCNLDHVDEELKVRKTIRTPEDLWIVSKSYTYLNVDKDDYSGRNWILHGEGKKYGRMYVSFETSEVRDLTIMEFYNGGVVD